MYSSKACAVQIEMPKDHLGQAIIRLCDISGDEITTETIAALDARQSRAANIPAFHFDALWRILNHPTNTPLVAKTYGGGALKVEPRALEQLPIPADPVRDKPRRSVRGRIARTAEPSYNVSAAIGLPPEVGETGSGCALGPGIHRSDSGATQCHA